jgi:hypothetical protein
MNLIGVVALAIVILTWAGAVVSWLVIAHNLAMSWVHTDANRYQWRVWRGAGIFVALWLVGVGARWLGHWLGNWGAPHP